MANNRHSNHHKLMTRAIAILNAETASVHVVTHLEETAEEAFQAWCEENDVSENNCQWMAMGKDASVKIQQLGAE